MFTSKKELKAELANITGLFNRQLVQIEEMHAENMGLGEKYATLEQVNDTLKDQAEHLQKNEAELNQRINKQNATIKEQKATIRKQTEADLLLNALQAVEIVPKPEGVDHFQRAIELQNLLSEDSSLAQQAAAQQQYEALRPRPLHSSVYGFGGIL